MFISPILSHNIINKQERRFCDNIDNVQTRINNYIDLFMIIIKVYRKRQKTFLLLCCFFFLSYVLKFAVSVFVLSFIL